VQRLLDAGYAVVGADVFQTGEFLPEGAAAPVPAVDAGFPGYTFCYNRPLLANRVQDILTVLAAAARHPEVRQVHLVGTGDAGVWTLLARGPAGVVVDRTVVDLQKFEFEQAAQVDHPNLLPGALKYGGLDGLASLAAPARIRVHQATGEFPLLRAASEVQGGAVEFAEGPLSAELVATLFAVD
jgi:hypothetical protein